MFALHEREARHHQIMRLLLEGDGLHGLQEEPPSRKQRDLSTGSLWFVREGVVRRYGASCGRSRLVDLHGPGSVAFSFAAFDGLDSLRAEPGSKLVELPLSQLGRIGRRQPEALVTVVAGLARHQSTLRSRLQLRSGSPGDNKVAGLLALLGEELGTHCSHGKEGWLDLPSLTHQDLADLLNSTRPHVSALMGQLVSEGKVSPSRSRALCVAPSCRHHSTVAARRGLTSLKRAPSVPACHSKDG